MNNLITECEKFKENLLVIDSLIDTINMTEMLRGGIVAGWQNYLDRIYEDFEKIESQIRSCI